MAIRKHTIVFEPGKTNADVLAFMAKELPPGAYEVGKRKKQADGSTVIQFRSPWFTPGDRVLIKKKGHPWNGQAGELLAYEQYGPPSLKMEGWRVALDNSVSTYAKQEEMVLVDD